MDSFNLNNTDGIAVHAGFPNAGSDATLEPLNLQNLLIPHPLSSYYFRLRGSDWIDFGIFDGDLVVVDRLPDPTKTDLIIWWHETKNSFCISRLADLPDGSTTWGVVMHIIHSLRAAK